MVTGSRSGRSFSLIGTSYLLRNSIDPPPFENYGYIIGLHVREASVIHQQINGFENDVSFIFRR
jgi:hypothetical protein